MNAAPATPTQQWARSMTDEALALKLDRLRESIRALTIDERDAVLAEAAHRLRWER